MTDNLMTSMNVVFPLFLIMALGYVLRHTGITTAAFNEIAAKLCFKVVLPVSIFNSIVSAGIKNAVNPRLSFWAVALFLIITAVSFVPTMLVSREPAKRGVLLQCAVRSNFVYIGLPIVENLFGSDGNAVAAGILPVIVIVYNVAAVVILASFSGGKQKIHLRSLAGSIFKNPLIIGAAAGVLYSLSGFPVPVLAQNTLSSIGRMATPLALLSLGGNFEWKAFGKNIGYIAFGTVMRNVITPLIALTAAVFIGFRGPELCVLLVEFAAPVAISSYPMAAQMNGDGELAGQLVVSTTALSIATMFLGVFLLKTCGWM